MNSKGFGTKNEGEREREREREDEERELARRGSVKERANGEGD